MNSSSSSKRLSFFLPFFNEEAHLANSVELICSVADSCLDQYEVILVNDGSTDGSKTVAEELEKKFKCVRVVHLKKNMGFGRAYLKGISESRFMHCMYLAADGDVHRSELETLLVAWDGKGNVLQYPLNPSKRNFSRFLLSKLFTFSVNTLTGRRWPYYNGFNIYNLHHIESLSEDDFGFAVQAHVVLNLMKDPIRTELVGTVSRYNDTKSKALTFKNIVKAFYLFSAIIKKT